MWHASQLFLHSASLQDSQLNGICNRQYQEKGRKKMNISFCKESQLLRKQSKNKSKATGTESMVEKRQDQRKNL